MAVPGKPMKANEREAPVGRLNKECLPMAENTNPRFTVKHVDGVMHLTVHPEQKAGATTATLRPLPPKVEQDEK